MQPTSPLRRVSVIHKIINFYKKKKLESLATITQQKDNLIHHIRINFKDYKNWQPVVAKKKSKKKYYYFNGYLFIFSYKFLKKYNKVIIKNKTYLYRTNKIESIDIDFLDDFIIAGSLIK
jgi:CMP-N-acetylneuraminic acid synthetase